MRPPRNEYKYVIDTDQKKYLTQLWEGRLQKDSYTDENARTPILSLYYDTPSLTFYHEKLDGIHTRNKVRLRTYNYDFTRGCHTVLEIKQRFADKVRKVRREHSDFRESLFDLNQWDFESSLQEDSFKTLINKHILRPTARVFYIREAYQCVLGSGIRVTYDMSLTALHAFESLSPDILLRKSRQVMPEFCCILEIKNYNSALPLWLREGIERVGLVQRPIPKYIGVVENLGLDEIRAEEFA